MPLIARQKKEVFTTIPVKFEEGVAERLTAYADFLDSSRDHVICASLRYIMERDRDFVAHLKATGLPVTPRKRGRPATTPVGV